jgi:hypothetical protein
MGYIKVMLLLNYVMLCAMVDGNQHSGGTWCTHMQARREPYRKKWSVIWVRDGQDWGCTK